jgi:hypothetical protein
MDTSFSFDKKRKLADRIQKVGSKAELQQIKAIIAENNPELSFMKNSNGYFLQFQNLSDATYIAITKYLDKLDKKKLKDIETDMIDNSEVISDENTALTDDASEKNVSKKLRLTNTESHILNRVKYEKELKKNELNGDEQIEYYNYENLLDNEIFIQNETKKKVNNKSKSKKQQ